VNAERSRRPVSADYGVPPGLSELSGGFTLAEGEDLAATLAQISDRVRQ